jgi:hypothetical protein
MEVGDGGWDEGWVIEGGKMEGGVANAKEATNHT